MLLNTAKPKYFHAFGTQSCSHRGNGRGQGIEDLILPMFIYYMRSLKKLALRYF